MQNSAICGHNILVSFWDSKKIKIKMGKMYSAVIIYSTLKRCDCIRMQVNVKMGAHFNQGYCGDVHLVYV